jgi:chaperonin GroES
MELEALPALIPAGALPARVPARSPAPVPLPALTPALTPVLLPALTPVLLPALTPVLWPALMLVPESPQERARRRIPPPSPSRDGAAARSAAQLGMAIASQVPREFSGPSPLLGSVGGLMRRYSSRAAKSRGPGKPIQGSQCRRALEFYDFAPIISSHPRRVLTLLQRAKFNICRAAGSFKTSSQGVSSMKIRPLHDRVIVKRLEEERTSPGGIVIPDTAAEKPIQGKVMAVGKGKILEDGKVRALDVKVGDKILFGKYSGTEVKVDGDDLVVMREEDVMAVIEGK